VKRLYFHIWIFVVGFGLLGCNLLDFGRRTGDIAEFVAPTAGVPQGNAIVRLEPSSRQVNVNDVTAIEMRIDNAPNLIVANVRLKFDPAILQVQDSDPGKDGVQIQPGNFPPPEVVLFNVVTNTTGLINFAAIDVAPLDLSNNSGVLATIYFQAIAQGTANLTFEQIELANNEAQPIPATSQSGQLTVGQGPTSTPTNTPIPGEATSTFTPIPSTDTPTSTPEPVVPLPPDTPAATPTNTPTNTPTPTATPTPTPGPPQVKRPPGSTLGKCYRVQPGDTLKSLAKKFGSDPRFISEANDLNPPGHIYPQQVIFLPTAPGRGPNIYKVQHPGDTLDLIAEQCQLEVEFLAWVNGLEKDANLESIEVLIIPRPPFAPPSRYPYPQVGPPSVWPPPCTGKCY
jgi:LysM repeat protein